MQRGWQQLWAPGQVDLVAVLAGNSSLLHNETGLFPSFQDPRGSDTVSAKMILLSLRS